MGGVLTKFLLLCNSLSLSVLRLSLQLQDFRASSGNETLFLFPLLVCLLFVFCFFVVQNKLPNFAWLNTLSMRHSQGTCHSLQVLEQSCTAWWIFPPIQMNHVRRDVILCRIFHNPSQVWVPSRTNDHETFTGSHKISHSEESHGREKRVKI